MHTHSDHRGTVGMGELIVVLNGVQFRTRHNDYKLNMPSKTSTEYGATEEISYPEVPPEVEAVFINMYALAEVGRQATRLPQM